MWLEERNGKYRYSERYTDPLTGRQKRVSVTLKKKSDKLAYQMLMDKISNMSAPVTEYTLGETAEAYLLEHKTQVRKSTYIRNERSINYTVKLLGGNILMNRLTAGYIRNKYLHSGKSARTENENMGRFKTFIKWAYRHDYIETTACIDKLERFRDTPVRERIQDKYLEREELSLLLTTVTDEANKLITEFLALSGLRIGELVALNDEDVTDVIRVNKTYSAISKEITDGKTLASAREVHIQPELAECIKQLRKYMRIRKMATGSREPFFVVSPRGRRLSYFAFNKWFRENTTLILEKPLTAHSLRHTHASLLAEAGYPLEAISRRLGHEDSAITKEIYIHVTEGQKKKDAELLDSLPPFCPQNVENFS